MDLQQRRVAAGLVLALVAALLCLWGWTSSQVDAPEPRVAAAPGDPGEGLSGPTLRGTNGRGTRPAGPAGATPDLVPADPQTAPLFTLRVDFVHAFTGRDLEATWNFGRPFERSQGPSLRAEAAKSVRQRLEAQVAAWEADFRPSGSTRTLVDVGEYGEVGVRLASHPPAGFVLVQSPLIVNTRLAAGVQTLVASIPLMPEAVLDVIVLGPDGQPADGASIADLDLGGEPCSYHVEDLGRGRLRVRGLPQLQGEAVGASLGWRGSGVADGASAATPAPGEDRREVRTQIPESLAVPWIAEITLLGPVVPLVYPHETDRWEGLVEVQLEEEDSTAPWGRVRVRLLGWEGRPIVGAWVNATATDANGHVLLERQPLGERVFNLAVPGRLPIRGSTWIRADQDAQVTLREDAGARLEIEVVDAQGRPLPAATVELKGNAELHFDQDGTTQRVDTFTDHLGRRAIARVAPGEGSVHARWGGRTGFEKVTLVDGITTRVRIFVK